MQCSIEYLSWILLDLLVVVLLLRINDLTNLLGWKVLDGKLDSTIDVCILSRLLERKICCEKSRDPFKSWMVTQILQTIKFLYRNSNNMLSLSNLFGSSCIFTCLVWSLIYLQRKTNIRRGIINHNRKNKLSYGHFYPRLHVQLILQTMVR